MTEKSEKAKANSEESEKNSFYVMKRVGKKFEPVIYGDSSESKMTSKSPLAAAKKAAMRETKGTGKDEATIFLRKAGVRDRVRKYECKIVPDMIIEPNSSLNRDKKGKKETFTAEQLVERNAWYAKHPINPKTQVAWTQADADARNADLKDGIIILRVGDHSVMRARKAEAKYIETIPLPDNTKLHFEKPETETKASAAPAAAPSPATEPEAAPAAAPATSIEDAVKKSSKKSKKE